MTRTLAPKANLTTDELIEELEWLAGSGVGMIAGCHRLGYQTEAVEKRLRRAERADLIARLRAQDPVSNAEVRRNRQQRWAASPEGCALLALYRRQMEHARVMFPDAESVQAQRRAVLAEVAP